MGASYPAGVVDTLGETLSLSTTLASLGVPGIQTKQAMVYVPSTDFRMQINPKLIAAYVYDNSLTGVAKWKDYSVPLESRGTVGTGTAMDSFTTSDRLYLCFSDVTGGVYLTVASVNDQANTMAAKYWNGAWVTLTPTDGTDTGASLAASGAVTWTAPTDAIMTHLGGVSSRYGSPAVKIDSGLDTDEVLDATETDITMDADPSSVIVAGDYILIESEIMYVNASSATGYLLTVTRGVLGSTAATHVTNTDTYIHNIGGPATSGFWVELSWDTALGTNTEISNVWALNKGTARGYYRAGVEYPISFDRRYTGAIELILAAGTDTAQVTWVRTVAGGG
jgi:hypothetical protein